MLRSAIKTARSNSSQRLLSASSNGYHSITKVPHQVHFKNHGTSAGVAFDVRFLSNLAMRRTNQLSPGTKNNNTLSSASRSFSDKPPSGGDKSSSSTQEETTSEIVLTPGQKVVAGTRLTLWAGIAVFASACAYYIGKELLPSKMSPNSVFSSASDLAKDHPEVKRRFGEPLKTYGRDHGGHREGRRNFVEHTEYKDKDDGSKRTRVRFNLQGQHGSAFVFAEVSSDLPSSEFVYILVQDKRNGHVITVQDNRSSILSRRLAGGSKEGQEAFANLLGGKK